MAKKTARKASRAPIKTRPKRQAATAKKHPYKRNFLSQVIARIDFVNVPTIASNGPPPKVVAAMKPRFPEAEQKRRTLTQVQAGPAGVNQSTHEYFEWFFHSKGRDKNIHINSDCMYVEYKKYESYAVLQEDFLTTVDALFDAVPELQVNRLGLRYVDTIEFQKEKDPTDWSEYLREDLLASFNLADDRRTISRIFNTIDFNYGDSRARFQFGMPNPDFPAPIRKKLFAMDFDAYCQTLLAREDIPRYLDEFHRRAKDAFEQVITDGLRKKMGKA